MKTIITIGEILVEIMAVEPGNGFLEPIPLIGPFPSGAPAIFIDQVAKLGQPCGIIGCVGNDDFGRLNRARLRRDGVDVSAVRTHETAVTGSAFVRYRPDGERDFVFNIKQSANGAIGMTDAAAALIERADHVHVMGTSLFAPDIVELTDTAIDRVKSRGGTVSFDPNLRKEMLNLPGLREALQRILERTDLFLPSGPELFLFTAAKDEADAVAEVMGYGVKAVVLKRGEAGASYFFANSCIHEPSFAVTEIDPTGAGDSFGATFVTAWLRQWSPQRALRYANASGALAVGRKGPMEGNSTMAELDALIASAGRSLS